MEGEREGTPIQTLLFFLTRALEVVLETKLLHFHYGIRRKRKMGEKRGGKNRIEREEGKRGEGGKREGRGGGKGRNYPTCPPSRAKSS